MEQNTLKRRGVGLTGVDKQRSFGGYTLFCPLTSDTAHLIDIDGNEVHSWTLPGRIGRHATILPNGNLAVNTLRPASQDFDPYPFPFFHKYGGGVMSELDPDGKIIRQFTDSLAHHDQYHYGDGRLLYASLEAQSQEESTKVIGEVPGSEVNGSQLRGHNQRSRREWKSALAVEGIREIAPGRVSLATSLHSRTLPLINSVIPTRDGNHVIAFMRSVSAVVIIEKSTGDIVWKLGPEVLAQQHNATELENGNILIFDNGAFRNG
jgi:hypothetical protein